MALDLRLRQVCLVADRLEPAASRLAAILGLAICHRDPHVAAYGLENAVMPVGTTFLEIVAPTRAGTAAGRFLAKTGGRGGYMAIFSCDDPDARGRHAASLGVRTANVIDHASYHGVQLHPRDCRAAFIEFNHTAGNGDATGAYPPAGPDWQRAVRSDVTQALVAVELQSPDPDGLARHWGRILQSPVTDGADIVLPNATLRVVEGEREALTALTLRAADVAAIRAAADAAGVAVAGDRFTLAGVEFRFAA